MTQHELLAFTVALRDHIQAEVGNRAGLAKAGFWPTRDQLAANLNLNRDCFGERVLRGDLPKALAVAERRHWVAVAKCTKDCHGRHIMVTELGLEALRLMDEHGCEGHGQWKKKRLECHRKGFRFAA